MKMILAVFLSMLLMGCAGMITRWDCASSNCLSKDRASNKCLAQANAAFSKNKRLIWEQCMRGEGFRNRVCEPHERRDPDCKVFHIF